MVGKQSRLERLGYALWEGAYWWALRRMGVVAAGVLCVVFLLSPLVSAADNPFSTGAYPIGWYDEMASPQDVPGIDSHGGNTVLNYWGSTDMAGRMHYLDEAAAHGIQVIMSIDETIINATDPVDVNRILDIVNTYNDHPALVGWYTADEPWYGRRIPLATMQTAYDTIKSVSTKPVFILFTEYAMYESTPSIPVLWKTAYDQFLLDVYPTRIGEPEFSRLEYEGRGKDFKADMQRAHEQSILADRPWWAVLSGWGSNTGESGNYRLPTYNESRFATYWSLSEEPTGILHFAYYRTGQGSVPARPDEPYPYDGAQWLDDVYEPQAAEINTLGPAVQNGKVTGAASVNTPDVRTDVYQDPNTRKYYLVTLNSTTGSETTIFSLDLPGREWISATPLFEGARPVIPITNGQFTDTFSQYEVHVYELQKATSRHENFEQYSQTTAWNPTLGGEGWTVASETSDPANSHQISIGSGGNSTQVYRADSSSDGQNMLAYWDRTIPDADADMTRTSIKWQMTGAYNEDQYRIGMSRQEGADYLYTWNSVFVNNFTDGGVGEGIIAGTMTVYTGDEYIVVDIPGGDSWEVGTWYILEVEEDNGEVGEGNGQMSRVRFGPLDGEMGDWTPWISHWADLDMDEGQIRLMTNGIGEYDNLTITELLVQLPGDADGDGLVSADDFASVQGNFGDTGLGGILGDANGDGVVSADDYGSVQLNFGNTLGMSGVPVPEPATLLLLSAAGVMMLRRRRHIN